MISDHPIRTNSDAISARLTMEVIGGSLVVTWGNSEVDPRIFFDDRQIEDIEMGGDHSWEEYSTLLEFREVSGGCFGLTGIVERTLVGPWSEEQAMGHWVDVGGGLLPNWNVVFPRGEVATWKAFETEDASGVHFFSPRGGIRASYEVVSGDPGTGPTVPRSFDLVIKTRFDLFPDAGHASPAKIPRKLLESRWKGAWEIHDQETGRRFCFEDFDSAQTWLNRFRPLWKSVRSYWGEEKFDLPKLS